MLLSLGLGSQRHNIGTSIKRTKPISHHSHYHHDHHTIRHLASAVSVVYAHARLYAQPSSPIPHIVHNTEIRNVLPRSDFYFDFGLPFIANTFQCFITKEKCVVILNETRLFNVYRVRSLPSYELHIK